MRTLLKNLLVLALGLQGSPNLHAQGVFENLDFESATVASEPPTQQFPNLVPIGQALPDWTAFVFGTQQTQVNYNVTTLGSPNVALLGPTWSSSDPGIIDGNYSIVLQAAPGADVSIAQTGTVPGNAVTIEFKAWETGDPSDIGVSFAGNSLIPVLISSGSTFNTYGVNISPFAGQTGLLEFSAIFTAQNATVVNLDDISFSPDPITVTPEPSPFALTAIGGVLFALYRRFVKR